MSEACSECETVSYGQVCPKCRKTRIPNVPDSLNQELKRVKNAIDGARLLRETGAKLKMPPLLTGIFAVVGGVARDSGSMIIAEELYAMGAKLSAKMKPTDSQESHVHDLEPWTDMDGTRKRTCKVCGLTLTDDVKEGQ